MRSPGNDTSERTAPSPLPGLPPRQELLLRRVVKQLIVRLLASGPGPESAASRLMNRTPDLLQGPCEERADPRT